MTHEAPAIDLTPSAQKYAVGLLSLAVTLVTALSVTAAGPWTLAVVLGVVVVGLQGVVAYIVPLLPGGWAGGLKTGLAVVLAVLAAILPLLTGTAWTFSNTLVVILAGINALAVQLGVAIRSDASVKASVAKPVTQVTTYSLPSSVSIDVDPATTSGAATPSTDPDVLATQEALDKAKRTMN